jgi:hypothetical protein
MAFSVKKTRALAAVARFVASDAFKQPTTMKCKGDCKLTKPLEDFGVDNTHLGKHGRRTRCRACISAKDRAYIETRAGFFSYLSKSCNLSSKRRGMGGHKLTGKDFEAKATMQGDLCFYSKLPLQCRPGSNWKASPERLNNMIDYTNENLVICAAEFNTTAQWTTAKFEYAITHSDTVDEGTLKANVASALTKKVPEKRKRVEQRTASTGAQEVCCNRCDIWKARKMFYTDLSIGCKACARVEGAERVQTWRNSFQLLVNNAVTDSRTRTKRGRENMDVTITWEDLLQKYKDQNGVCMYSGIPLSCRKGNWRMSLERYDCTLGYTVENTCLIVMELNSCSRNTKDDEGNVVTVGQWSAEKFEFVKHHYITMH